MSENVYAIHAASLSALQAELGVACPQVGFVAYGESLNILPGSARLRSNQTVGGFQMDSDFVFTVLVSEFGNTTAEAIRSTILNTELDYLGHQYKVIAVHVMGGGLQLHIEANDLNQAA